MWYKYQFSTCLKIKHFIPNAVLESQGHTTKKYKEFGKGKIKKIYEKIMVKARTSNFKLQKMINLYNFYYFATSEPQK